MISFFPGEICAKHDEGCSVCSRRGCRPCRQPVDTAWDHQWHEYLQANGDVSSIIFHQHAYTLISVSFRACLATLIPAHTDARAVEAM